MSEENNELEKEQPPIMGSWPKLYAFVIGFLIFEIILFYLFTVHYA